MFFHNRTNYDFNLLINEFAKEYKGDINCIPLNTNKHMSFSVPIKKEIIEPNEDDKKKRVLTYNLRFIDSARHVSRVLSEYMDSMDKFKETELPSIDKFYSTLQKKNVNKKNYAHAKKLWNIFHIKTLGDYHDVYVPADTAQLSDVFESFRSKCLEVYSLDLAYFVSTPRLAFQALLKVTKAEIEVFTDIDIILMTEKGIRGGLTQVVKKCAKANNKYLPDYDGTKKSVFLQYLDANNLYGYAMCKKLPLKGYK